MRKNSTRRGKGAIVLLSGGLDSTTTLYLARKMGYGCLCLGFDYGQRHKKEILAAKKIARTAGCRYQLIRFGLPWKGSSLIDKQLKIPQRANGSTSSPSLEPSRAKSRGGLTGQRENLIPNTYVPARNIIFLSFAVSFAEAENAEAIFIGANAVDYSGYPDCREQFYRQFIRAIAVGTKSGVEGKGIKIITPLIRKSKKEIVQLGDRLGVPFGLTWSCYKGGKVPCGVCDSCRFRKRGFQEAGLGDPLYVKR